MNWKRGFFRLWMAFAAVCLVGALLANVGDIVDPHVNRTFYYDADSDLLLDRIYSIKADGARRALDGEVFDVGGKFTFGRYTAKLPDGIYIHFLTVTQNDTQKSRVVMWPNSENGKVSRSDDEITPRMNELMARAENEVRQELTERQLNYLGVLAGVGIGLPLAFLAFGAAIAWILKGFRKEA